MEINRTAFGALALAGIVAASGGAYLATRHNEVASVRLDPSTLAPAAGVVTETENAIAPTPADPAERVQPAPIVERPPVPQPAVRRAQARPQRVPVAEAARPAPRPATSAPPAPPAPPVNVPNDPPVAAGIEPLDATTVERTPAVQEPPRKVYDDLVIPADSVIGLQVENSISSDRAKVEDDVRARVTRDVRVRDRVAIPAGSRAEGTITLVERGGRLKEQARLGIRFHTLVLADGTRLPIKTETIYREGESPARASAAKIGGAAVGGAVLGAIFGGKKGAVIGSTVGAAGGGAAVAASEPSTATLPAGATVTVKMDAPTTVTVER